eukprot:TRINITY_DN4338_c0_g1_i1.p1 TRINITY_DN4338_c0_g1~~TRINITY_DN4338_c0_g1_i1.p1  ORF type:complete len:260 (+),score=23.41 TRINITY_DN4338_c0_g1_i1:67-846(+)
MRRRPPTLAALALAVSLTALWWALEGHAFLTGMPRQFPGTSIGKLQQVGFRPSASSDASSMRPSTCYRAHLVISLGLLALAAAPRSRGGLIRKKDCRARCVMFAHGRLPPRLAQDDVGLASVAQHSEPRSEDLLGLHVGVKQVTHGRAPAPDASSRQRRQRRTSHGSSHRSSHRNVGARLLRHAVTPPEPIAPSYDPSKVRLKLQCGVRMQAVMRSSHPRKEQRAAGSSFRCLSLVADSLSQRLMTNNTSRSLCLRRAD